MKALEHLELDFHLDQNAQIAVANQELFWLGTMRSAPSSEARFAVVELLRTQNPSTPNQAGNI